MSQVIDIKFEKQISETVPSLKVLKVEADIVNRPTDESLESFIVKIERDTAQMALDAIKQRPGIASTRAAYKALGKEPNRYRPAAESLCRRIVRGLGLYRVNAAVDVINVISILTGYSIGGFDIDKIDGDTITLGVGAHDEPYEGIGRGLLNIEHLPVFRDGIGGIGTPTSDNERTKLDIDTRRLLLTINIYGEEMGIADVKELTTGLLERFLDAKNIGYTLYRSAYEGSENV